MESNSIDVPSNFLTQVERRNIAVANCDAKNERTNVKEEEEEDHRVETKSDRVQELQVQMQPQMQQTDTRADR